MALVIVEEIMNDVFARVGLVTNEESTNGNKGDGWGSKAELRKAAAKKAGDVKDSTYPGSSSGVTNLIARKNPIIKQQKIDAAVVAAAPPLVTEQNQSNGNSKDFARCHHVAQGKEKQNVNSSSLTLTTTPSPITPPVHNINKMIHLPGRSTANNMMSLSDWQVQLQQRPQCSHRDIFSFMDDSPPLPPLSSSSNDYGNGFQERTELSAYSSIGSSSFFEETAPSPLDMPLPLNNDLDGIGSLDGWMRSGMKRYPAREKSLFAEFFNKQHHQPNTKREMEELLMVSSTAASIASSTGDEQSEMIIRDDDDDDDVEDNQDNEIGSDSTSENENDNQSPLMDDNETEGNIEFVV
eukprot:14092608-Ditylum_brightwellii.AAC.1